MFNEIINENNSSLKELEKNSSLIDYVFSSISEPFYIIDVNTYEIIFGNKASGYRANAEINICYKLHHNNDFPCNSDVCRCPLDIIKASKKPITIEHKHFDENHELKYVELNAYPVFNGENEITHRLVFSRDITAKKKLEFDLISEKNVAERSSHLKNLFIAKISHEIRTPLSAISGFSDLIMDFKNRYHDKEMFEYIDIIKKNSLHLTKVIEDMLDLAKIEAGKIILNNEPFNFEVLIKDVYSIIKAKITSKDVDFIVDSKGISCVNLIGDPVRIKQIIINILGNSVKYTKKGKISLYVKSCFFDQNRDLIELIFNDTGKGINPSNLKNIFQPFFFEKSDESASSSGLGLAITKQIVDTMKGHISVKSKEGVGTSYTVKFKLARNII